MPSIPFSGASSWAVSSLTSENGGGAKRILVEKRRCERSNAKYSTN